MKKTTFAGKILIAMSFLLLAACHAKTKEVEPKPQWFEVYSSFDMKDYQNFFQREIIAMSPDFVPYGAWVKQFYEERDGVPLWTMNGLQEQKVDTLYRFISEAYTHGLPVSSFYLSEVDSCLNLLKNNKVENEADVLYEALFHLEMNLTESFLRYASTMYFGATDPKKVNGH